jgi:hypothetical protein
MASDHQFGLFQDDAGGPLWRASFADLDEAKRNARRLADEERRDFFVCRFEDYSEIARMFPTRNKTVDVLFEGTRKIDSAREEAK